jgi:hypothetical protein
MDIRKLLEALAPEDKDVWQRCRTDMRKAYINAHNTIHGVERWELEDDAFLDLIDIKIATLFDRNGRLENADEVIPSASNIEDEIRKAVRSVDSKVDYRKSVDNNQDSQKSASPDELLAIGEAVMQLTAADKQAAVPTVDPTKWGNMNMKAIDGSSTNG